MVMTCQFLGYITRRPDIVCYMCLYYFSEKLVLSPSLSLFKLNELELSITFS